MNIKSIREYDLGIELRQVRSVPVQLGHGRPDAVLFVYSSQGNLDPWPEQFNFPKDTLKMALYSEDGVPMWKRDLGNGVIPGVWYTPFISFDLDGDGVDEIWIVNNLNPNLPFSLNARVLERIDPVTGKTTGQWKWPDNTIDDTMSHSYRFFLTGGYVHDKPVLVTAQGTYRNMYLQGHEPSGTDISKRWEIMIPFDDGGARSSHLCPVLDFDEDGVDELFWGERLISLDDGHEVFCGDKGKYLGHSDIVAPFEDIKTGRRFIFTCREDYEKEGEPRVVTYDEKGQRAWTAVPSVGHMHNGWLANIGQDYRKVAMAMRITRRVINNSIVDTNPEDFYFDAVTGESLENVLPFKGDEFMPVDFDGDGYHEFYGTSGDQKGYVVDARANVLGYIGGSGVVRSGKVIRRPGEMLMVFYRDEGKVRIWADLDACESDYTKKRYSNSYHWRMQHFMGTGYNHAHSHITCGM